MCADMVLLLDCTELIRAKGGMRVCQLTVADATGSMAMCLFNEYTDRVQEGDILILRGGKHRNCMCCVLKRDPVVWCLVCAVGSAASRAFILGSRVHLRRAGYATVSKQKVTLYRSLHGRLARTGAFTMLFDETPIQFPGEDVKMQ